MSARNEMNRPAALVGDREIASTRVFEAPRELVYGMWTDPKHLSQWWGPKGFVTVTFAMDVRPGGVWRFVMQGPDGREYQNNITYGEVVPGERLVYTHGGARGVEPASHTVTVTFADAGAGRTVVNMRMVFPSAKQRDFVVKTYGAVEGLDQTLGRLVEVLAEGPAFVISREFDAPVGAVWAAWTERERLMSWFGPKGFTMPKADLDLRPGGVFHYCLRGPDGKELWGKFVFREIIPERRIVLVNSFSDQYGGITRHPFSPDWPLEMLTTTTFAEHGGKTTLTVQWSPINATEVERRTFEEGMESMRMGWGGTFEQLAGYLAKG